MALAHYFQILYVSNRTHCGCPTQRRANLGFFIVRVKRLQFPAFQARESAQTTVISSQVPSEQRFVDAAVVGKLRIGDAPIALLNFIQQLADCLLWRLRRRGKTGQRRA